MPTTIDGWLGASDHKPVGRLFIGGGVLFLVTSFVLALAASYESVDGLDFQIVGDLDEFTQLWSISRDLMIFGGLVPILLGIGIYLVPLQIGASSLAFARGAAGAFWTWLLGSGLLIVAYLLNGGPGGGRRDFVVLWAASLAMMVGAITWGLVVLASTVLGARTVGMTTDRVPFTSWSYFIFSLVGLFSLPVVLAELLIAFLNVRYQHVPIEESEVLVGVLDGVTQAPAIYWLAIPVLGMAVDIIGVHTGVPVRFHRTVMGLLTVFGLLTFGPHLIGMASLRIIDYNNVLLVLGLLAVVLPVLGTLALAGDSLRSGSISANPALAGALLSGLLVLAATAVRLLGLVEPIMGFFDSLFPDAVDMTNSLVLDGTTFHEAVKALVVGAVVVGVIAALHHWSSKLFGRSSAASPALLAMALAAAGSVIWAAGELAAGIADQPQYPELVDTTEGSLQAFGVVATIGVALLLGAVAMIALGLAGSMVSRKPAGSSADTWSGTTLEWAAPSPPPLGNFPAPPIVVSATPLAHGELAYDGLRSGSEGSGSGDAQSEDAESAPAESGDNTNDEEG
jgi:heme/copper-type cytochrome/quinol oxidase subunit 1